MELERLLKRFLDCTGVSIDTRTINPGELFVALKGPNFNGNEYIPAAFEKGAGHIISDDLAYAGKERVTVVEDSLETLQKLATAYRQTWDCPVVGLTGSNGKTTTKELLAKMLDSTYRVYATEGNLNNHIGVPLSLLRAPANSEVVIIEMGANHVGEIADLAEIARPTHGFITNIGRAHLEGFGGLDGVRQGKGELFDFLKRSGQAFVNIGDEETYALSQRAGRTLFFASDNQIKTSKEQHLILRGHLETSYPFVSGQFIGNDQAQNFKSHLPGEYNFQNIIAAAAVAYYFKVPLKRIAESLETYIPSNSRSEIREVGESKVLFDVYNANPDSVAAALSWLSSRKETNKVVVLGELAELGAFAKTEHEKAVDLALKTGTRVVLYGAAYQGMAAKNSVFTKVEPLKTWLKKFLSQPDTVILLKGSRSNRLERLLED